MTSGSLDDMTGGWVRVEGAPGIYRRGSRYVVTYRDATGAQRRVAARTLREARRLKAERTATATAGAPEPDRRVVFGEYAPEVLRFRSRELRPHVAAEYERVTKAWLLPRFGKRKLVSLTAADVRGLVDEILGAGLSANTARNYVKPLRVVMGQALADGLVQHDVFRGVRIATPSAETDEDELEGRAKALTREQLDTFLRVVPPRWKPFFALIATTGLRFSEAIGLRWCDVDLEGRACVRVRQAIVEGRVGRPKTRNSRRTVPLAPDVVRLLRAHRDAALLADRGGGEQLVFPSDAGTPIIPENLRRRVLKPAAEEAGCGWAGFHAFRHTCASLLIAEGRSIVQVSRWLGHATPAFTLSTYAHWLDGDDLGEPLCLPARAPTYEDLPVDEPAATAPLDETSGP